jgi:hypothetical protein
VRKATDKVENYYRKIDGTSFWLTIVLQFRVLRMLIGGCDNKKENKLFAQPADYSRLLYVKDP